MKNLTQEIAQKIIDEYCQGSSTYELADKYDRWQTSICNLISGRSWKQCHRPENILELIKLRHEKGCFTKGYKDYLHNKYPSLTDKQKDIVIGSLLGDGYLRKIVSTNPNSLLSKKQSKKYKEYIDWHHQELLPFSKPVIKEYSEQKPISDENGMIVGRLKVPKYLSAYVARTCSHPVFTELRKRWYPEGTKIVPNDLRLTPLSIAIWFCDDGCNSFDHREAVFCTQSFTIDEADFLCKLLKEFNITARFTIKISAKTGKEQPIVKVNSTSYDNLIELIKPHVPWGCMSHKIKWRPAMEQWQISGKFTEYDVIKIFDMSQTRKQHEIATMFGVHKNTISSLLRGDSWQHLQHLNPYIPKSIRSN